jgi:hypothetical protein
VICRVDGTVYRGRAVTLSSRIGPEVVARAVREGTASGADGVSVTVTARTPSAPHGRVGCLYPEMGLRIRTALAAAARARGLETPHDPALQRARERIAARETEGVETRKARERLASARAGTDRLRERVAAARGRLRARAEHGVDTDPARERLEEAARELSETETAAAAARQSLGRRRREARRARDDLETRLRLEDEVANLERRARAALVDRTRDTYAAAVADAPGGAADPDDPFAVAALTAGLGVARVAAFHAPVVLTGDRFDSARAASQWLGAPAVRI